MKITTILKRDGRKQKYDRGKITMAIWKSLWAVSQVKRKFPQITDVDKIARRAAEIEVPHQQADNQLPLWKESERLAKIVEDTLIRSNPPRLASGEAGGSHRWQVEEIQDVVEQVLSAAGQQDAAQAYILYRNSRSATREREGSDLLKRSDPLFLGMSDNAYAAMAKRYLWKDKDGNVIETPKQAMERVAAAVSEKVRPWAKPRSDLKTSKKYWRNRYLDIMTSFEFVPAGCYFRGAGNKQNGSLANCFVLPVEDSIGQIFDAVKWAALIHAAGGGTGFNFSHLRPRGDLVKGGGLASGPINFMKAFDAETQIVMQGGEHRGANMGILNVDHPDIFEFIRAKSIDGEVSNFNISVGVFDKFMKTVERGSDWPLVNPRDKLTVQNIPARALWDEIVSLAWRTGDPGMIYLDTINRYNPIMKALGPIEATNVCGEQVLHPFDVCNLGSINLSKFVISPWWKIFKGRTLSENINWSRLESVIRTAVRFLDDGIDASTYPIPQIAEMAHKLRRIGLGVMGWADMLVKLGVRYDSDEGIKLAESIMKFIQNVSWDESERLAKEKATFPLWEESYFNSKNNPFGKIRPVRNVAVTTIAPTGTISMISDCSSGIEPYFALEYTKNVVEKEGLKYTNKYYEEAKKALSVIGSRFSVVGSKLIGCQSVGLEPINRKPANLKQKTENGKLITEIFRTAHEISPDWHVKMQAAFQKYTDNAVSKTINFETSTTVKDVENAYLLAWKLGCKGITVYRDGSRAGQILNEGSDLPKRSDPSRSSPLAQSQIRVTPLSQRAYRIERQEIVESVADGHCPECGAVMISESGCSTCYSCGYSKCSL